MALGGGLFTSQNKRLPGAYMNFINAARATASVSDRGVVAIPYTADWGPEDEVVEISSEEFIKSTRRLFGYDYSSSKLRMFREIFKNARLLYGYRLNSKTVKASNTFATAKYGGTRGNAIQIVIQKNVDEEALFDVTTIFDGSEVDQQTVGAATELIENDYVTFKADADLEVTAGTPLTGGTNGTERDGGSYQSFLDKIEQYSFHALGCNAASDEVTGLFIAFTKRMRDEVGVKFQTVVYRARNADYEGIVSVENEVLNTDDKHALVYWVTGAVAGCAINADNTNKIYDGEYEVDVDYTQADLATALDEGKFILHNVNGDVRVLEDINTFVSRTEDKGEDFSNNQTIRVIDQIGNDIAVLFNTKYLGKIQNNESGRVSFWADLVQYNNTLQDMKAIENFVDSDITVEPGDSKKSIVVSNSITVVNSMRQLYMTTVVS